MNYGGSSSMWINLLIIGLGIYLASEAFKKKNDGYVEHTDISVFGFWIGVTTGVITAIFTVVQLSLDPEILNKTLLMMEAELERKNAGERETEAALEIISKIMKPVPLSLFVLFFSILSASIVGAILGFFLKREKSIF
jgi:uncharacterized membrane protein